MKIVPALLDVMLVIGLASSMPAPASTAVQVACETNQGLPEWADPPSEVPHSAFRLEVVPDSYRSPGKFSATIAQRNQATIELMRFGRACRMELSAEACPAITDIADAFEHLHVAIGKDHAMVPDVLYLHATTYRIQVRGPHLERHSLFYYGEQNNPILSFMHDARERLLACLPASVPAFVDPPTSFTTQPSS